MGIYASEYTGAEHDVAVGRILGNKYQDSEDPGCHLIGTDSSNPQNLFEVILPGKYTIFFYEDIATGNVPITMPFAGNSPIFMQVTYDGENHHYQRITIGAGLYYRDLMSGNYDWIFVDMGVQQIDVIDNLTSRRTEAALSANMGRELKSIIDNLSIGNLNLINNSGLLRGTQGWYMPAGVTRYNGPLGTQTQHGLYGRPTFKMDGSVLTTDVEYLGISSEPTYIVPNKDYTSSVWVRKDSIITNDIKVYLQIDYYAERGTSLGARRQEFMISSSVWSRIKFTYEAPQTAITATISFGIQGSSAKAYFALPKLEEGTYATEWNPSYYDMWCEFDNANFINEVLVDTDNLQEQDGLVYRSNSDSFVNYPVATGGGGGFYSTYQDNYPTGPDGQIAPPNNISDRTELLWNVLDASGNHKQTYQSVKFYNGKRSIWQELFAPPMYYSVYPPEDFDTGWLDMTNEDDTITATLKYYDKRRGTWRPVTARSSGIWYFGTNAPSDVTLMWIKTPDMIPHLYYQNSWVPLHAIWGKNISGT